MTSLLLKPHSTPATLLWLQANYEPVEGVCIPRNALYNQIIRQKFPGLTTRRLGTRGQSRYHYYGLAVKSDANLYARSSFTRYGCRFTETKLREICVMPRAQSRGTNANPLFTLPTDDILSGLPKHVSQSGATTIHIMYTMHCQQLIDYSVHFQFKEVKEYIAHFWGGFPVHLFPLLENNSIVSLIGVCDFITYRAITHSTLPCVILEEVPTKRTEDVMRLAENILDWLVSSLVNAPSALRRLKLHAARTLLHSVRRQVSLNHLCSNLRFMLASEIHLKQMITDWEHLDMQVVSDEIIFSVGISKVNYATQIILSCCKDLEKILRQQPQLSDLGDWMKELVERCVTNHTETVKYSGEHLKNFACHFVLIWSSIGTRILRELTLLGAHSFGAFHLLYLMLTDYGAELVESLIVEDRIHRLTKNIALGNPPDSSDFEAGNLCDAQCPCKLMCHKEALDDKSLSIQTTTNSPNFPDCGGDIMTDSCLELYTDPSDEISEGRYSQVYSDYPGVYYQPTNGSDSYNPAQQLICRPSCSFQEPPNNGNPQGNLSRNPSSSKSNTKDGSFTVMNTDVPTCPGSIPVPIEEPGSYHGPTSNYSPANSDNYYYMVSTSLSGGQCFDNFYSANSTISGGDSGQY
ncbi:unnamed protein product [Allacma fusca]|uniref:RFX-type winged-helix domain-containing protein n=1 Tax=Allacma fusca TaxID=39272 RepID=A0A8J2KFE0_9HEXA|nr:unnamed protein product [Allacma fusca]